MASTDRIQPINTEEKIIWVCLVFAYVFYLSGTLYVVGALMGWALFFVMLLRWFVEGKLPVGACVPVSIWVWIIGMLFMLIALIVAHAEFNLGTGQTIKSTIGWAKGWALLALFPLLGSMLLVRPQLLVRASCILASQALMFVPVGITLAVVGFHGHLYTSPLSAVGGPISTFEVSLYGLNPETGKPRWSFFAPWAPAAGLLSCVMFIICSQEKNTFWRRAGLLGALTMCLFCQSRTGWAIFLVLIPMIRVKRIAPIWILFGGVMMSAAIVLSEPILDKVNQVHQDIKDSRPGSTRVRNSLATIAVQRWESEAPVWGHGVVERGPKMVEFMPIGSHHSWYGLLFVKGVVGLLALAIPLFITFLCLTLTLASSHASRPALMILMVFVGYSFFENLEILSYLYWPALMWLGMALNPLKTSLFFDSLTGVNT